MKKFPRLLASGLALWGAAAPAFAAEEGAFAFFDEERQVITASRVSQEARLAPATAYVITQDDIRTSGAQNLWDALRMVPGVDVMTTRTGQGEVSIRGFGGTLSNNVLVMLDGKTVQNGFFDFTIWEEIPVSLEEIDRIEVVEGPVSALYGANGTHGAINIITKTPDQLKGGVVSYTGGQRKTHFGSAAYGGRRGKTSFKAGAAWRSMYRVEAPSIPASKTGKGNFLVKHEFSEKASLALSAGGANLNTELSLGANGTARADGLTSFSRVDLRLGGTAVRTFWNRGRIFGRDLGALGNPDLNYDTYDANLEQAFSLPFSNNLVAGASYRKNTMRSRLFGAGRYNQNLWALFMEDEWKPLRALKVVASARSDHHPLAGQVFSPRGSVILAPTDRQSVRFSGGSSFRNPTLLENYLSFPQMVPNPPPGLGPVPNPPYSFLLVTFLGNKDLKPERITMWEVAHNGKWGRINTAVVGFVYKMKNLIATTDLAPAAPGFPPPPTFPLVSSFTNQGETKAKGGEVGLDAAVIQGVTAFANFAYVKMDDNILTRTTEHEAPLRRVNVGVRGRRAGFSGGVWINRVDETSWNMNVPGSSLPVYGRVDGYATVNAYAGYQVSSGAWKGLEAGIGAYNLTDRKHYEILPAQGMVVGQNGELVRGRFTGTVSYRF